MINMHIKPGKHKYLFKQPDCYGLPLAPMMAPGIPFARA